MASGGAASNSSDAAEYRQADDDNWYTMEEFRDYYQQPLGTFGAWRQYLDRAGLASTHDVLNYPHARAVERLKHVRRDALATSIGIPPPSALSSAPTPSPAAGASTPCALPLQPSRAQDPHGRLERALVAAGVAGQGITRTGTEPITDGPR